MAFKVLKRWSTLLVFFVSIYKIITVIYLKPYHHKKPYLVENRFDTKTFDTKKYDLKKYEPKWLHKFVLPYAEFHPQTTPIVIFSNYRHKYLKMCLEGIQSATQDIQKTTPCYFVLHRINTVTEEDIELTLDMIQHVEFCKVKILEMNRQNPVESSARIYKFLWWSAVQELFDSAGLLSKEMPGYQGDVFFIEEDAVVSPDFMRVLWYALRIKNTFGPNIYQVALGGYAGENTINAHSDTFVVRKTAYFQAMAYAFNGSFWRTLSDNEKFILLSNDNDFSMAITWWFYRKQQQESFHIVVPTLSRMWHVGVKGLGDKGDAKEDRQTTKSKPWQLVPRFLNISKAEVNAGIRDMFGFLCRPEKLTKFWTFTDSECRWSDRLFQDKNNIQCHPQPYVRDKCGIETF